MGDKGRGEGRQGRQVGVSKGHRPILTRLGDKGAVGGQGSRPQLCSLGSAQVHLAWVQLDVLLLLKDAANHRLQDLV